MGKQRYFQVHKRKWSSAAKALLDGMKPGDFVNIPAFKKHRVDWTMPNEPTVWLGVRYGEAK